MASDFQAQLKTIGSRLSAPASESALQSDLQALKPLTAALLSNPSSIDPQRSDLLLKALPGFLTAIVTTKKAEMTATQQMIGDLLSDVMLMLPKYAGNSKYLEALKVCVDYEKPFFKTSGQDLSMPLGFSYHPDFSDDSLRWWQSAIGLNDSVEAVKIDIKTNRKRWALAKVVAVDDDFLTLAYEDEGSQVNRYLKRYSQELAPPGTYTKDDAWRKTLHEGDLVDAFDLENLWYNSTVLEKRHLSNSNGSTTTEVLIGFRVYESGGEKLDDNGPYRGWSSRYDEWISVQSPRLAKYSEMARRWPIPPVATTEEPVLEDSNDVIEQRPWAFAMVRDAKSRNKYFIRNLNRFGVAGMFESLLRLIKNEENPLSLDCFCALVDCCGRISPFYHKFFARSFIQRFIDTASDYLLTASESQVRGFSKEKLDSVCSNFEQLYKRLFTIQQKNEKMDHLNLSLALKCFQSQYLERKIQGLKVIVETVKSSKFPQNRSFRPENIAMWVWKFAILEGIFGPLGHTQLIQRSGDLIHLLLTENCFDIKLLQLIWSVAERADEDSKMTIYKVLGENSSHFKPEHLELLIDRISSIPSHRLLKEEIELVHDLTRFPLKASAVLSKASELLWKIVREDVHISEAVAEQALERYCEIMKGWDMRQHRINVLIRCTRSIGENAAAVQCMKIIRKILPIYPLAVSTSDILSKHDVQMVLISDYDLMAAFFDNFRHFKQQAETMVSPDMSDDAISALVVCDRSPYKEQVEERLTFLHTLYANSKLRLTQQYVSWLWEMCLEKSLCISERLAFLTWLADVTGNAETDRVTLDESGVVPFFHQKVASAGNEVALYSPKAFQVFRNYFLLANVLLGRMQSVPRPSAYQTAVCYCYNTYYSNAPEPAAEPEFEYRVLSPPEYLEGMTFLRNLVLKTRFPMVVEEATVFLCELYEHLGSELQPDLAAIRREFIDFCKEEISLETHKAQAIALLKRFLEESEKRGTGGLKSHSAALRGDVHTITMLNQVSYFSSSSSTVPKKFELKLPGNTTLWELRCMVGKTVKLYSDQVKLARSFTHKEIKDNENGKTIAELRIKTQDTLIVSRKTLNIQKEDLMTPSGDIAPRAKAIFQQWFHEYADREGKMNSEACANFTNSCTGDPCKAEDRRINDLFAKFDDDGDGVLTEANFLEFYRDAILTKQMTVWNNLYAHHYRNDLKSYLDLGSAKVDVEALPSYLLTQDQTSFELLFSALSDPLVANDVWGLLVRLPTNPQIQEQLRTLDCEEGQWDALLDPKSVHKLLYSLQIIEALVENPVDDNVEERRKRTEWKLKFLQKGGFKHVYGIIKRLESREDIFHKNCLVYILNLVSVYLLAAFSALEPEVYEAVEFVRRGSEITDVQAEPEIEPPKKKTVRFADSTEPHSETPYGPAPVPAPAAPKDDKLQATQQLTQTKAFHDLVEGLKAANTAGSVIADIDFRDVMEKLIVLVSGTLEIDELENEDKHIVEASLALLVSCVLHNHQLISIFYSFCQQSQGQTFIVRGLTCPKSIPIRKAFSSSLLQICLHADYPAQQPQAYFLQELIGRLPGSFVDSAVADYGQYFDLMCSLVVEDLKAPSQDYQRLAGQLMERVAAHPCQETRLPYAPDKVLQGLLQVSEKIFLHLPQLKHLAQEKDFPLTVWKLCLFPDPLDYSQMEYNPETAASISATAPPKCKLRETRSAAYRLITTLSTSHPANLLSIVHSGLYPVKARLDKVTGWGYSPSSEMRSLYGYSGIVNLGYICYMVSMLQQFYMIPQFKYAILEAEDGKLPTNLGYLRGDPGVDRTKKGADVDENLLHQLQAMFGYLELSEKQAYNPAHFCFAFKDIDGNPTNISLQQDAQEFLNIIFDRLETSLKGTQQELLLKSVFGGKTCNRFVCQGGCKVTNERFEDFYNLSLDVKHSKTIYESLDRFVSGEVISDFYCENCDKNVEMVKKTSLVHLPNVLIIHLQRIIYNFDTYGNEKINSKLEFPQILNLQAYSKEAILRKEGNTDIPVSEAGDYEYELTGVVVHSGTAEGGHYISLIRHRLPDGSLDPKKWFEFNDSLVSYFDPNQLEADCFGGTSDFGDDLAVGFGKAYTYSKETSRCAYMLVYQRKVRTPLKLLKPILEGDSTTSPRNPEFKLRPYDQLVKTMPAGVLRAVLQENEKFNFERNLYSPEFFRFFADIIQASVPQPEINLTKLGTQFSLDVMAHAFDNRLLPDITATLKQLYSRYPEECITLFESILADNMRGTLELLLVCTDKTTRTCIAELLAHILNQLIKLDDSEDGLAKRFMSGLLELVPKEAHKHWVRFKQFWDVFRDFSLGGEKQAHFLIEKGAIGILIDFFLGNSSPLLKPGEKRPTFGNKMWGPTYDGLIQTISILADYCTADLDNLTDPGIVLDEDSQRCITDKEFVDKALRGGFDGPALGKIIAHWGKNNYEYSHKVAHIILKVLNDIEYEEVKGLYDVLDAYITIQDEYQRLRVEWLMGFPVPIKSTREDQPYFGSAIITAIDDEVWTYVTPLCFSHNAYETTESILYLIWKHRKRYDQYCVVCIKNLFGICLKSKELTRYMEYLPAPTYQYARYIDWIEEFLMSFKDNQASWNSYAAVKDDSLPEAMKVYAEFKSSSVFINPFPFVIGKTIASRVYDSLAISDVYVTITEYTTFYSSSDPTGKANSALPWLKLRSEIPQKSFTLHRPAQLNLEAQKSYPPHTGKKSVEEELVDVMDGKTIAQMKASMDVKTYTINEPETTWASEAANEPEMELDAVILLRFTAKNVGNEGQRVILQVKSEGERNYLSPQSEVTVELTGKSEKDLLVLVKRDVGKEWGDLNYQVRLEQAQTFTSKGEGDEFKDTMANYYAIDEANVPISDVASVDDEVKAPAGLISCPTCTYFNASVALKCEMCGTSFKTIA